MRNGKAGKKKRRNDFFFVCRHVKFSWGLIILALVVGSIQSVVTSMVPDATDRKSTRLNSSHR